ncbi:hypothetical protein LI142_08110 [Eubacterium limosum]|uniref:hypothetical protein n=1 Tax=Eubacterium limosum TaxID=1736 RepID=UPI001D0819B6|nr:hypothetical protein [Eubacterium limosum]MCB6569462.1 hypothetical protein [Eubacterium limosum]
MDLHIDSRDIRVTVQDIISVQDDTNTQVIEFVFTKELLEYALWELNAFVIYAVSGSTGVRFDICTKTVTDTELKVQWVIRKPVTYAEGKLQFQVVFTDTPDPITKVSEHRWSTKIAMVTIPKTLAREKYAIDTEPVIEQMMAIAAQCVEAGDKVSRAEAAAVRAEQAADSIQEAVDANNAAQAAKTETISAKNATIAAAQTAQLEAEKVQKIVAGNEAYTKTESDLKYTVAPRKEASTSTGELKLTDADDGLSYLELQGNSEQYTATGTNLFDVKQLVKTMQGLQPEKITLMQDSDGKFMRITNNYWHNGRLYTFVNDITKSYEIGFKGRFVSGSPGHLIFAVKFKDGTIINTGRIVDEKDYKTVNTTIPIGKEVDYMYFTYGNSAGIYDVLLNGFYLYPTDSPSEERPTGGYGTPTPEYPSKVRSVGDIPKDVNGVEIRNLLDEEWIKSQPESAWTKAVSGSNTQFRLQLGNEIKKKVTVTAFLKNTIPSGKSFSFTLGNQVGMNGASLVYNNAILKGTADYTAETYVNLYITVNGTTTATHSQMLEIFNYFNFMVTEAAEIDEYRPYIGENNGLVKIESAGVNFVNSKDISNAGGGNSSIVLSEDGSSTVFKQTDIAKTSYNFFDFKYEANKTYTVYCRSKVEVLSGSGGGSFIGIRKKDMSEGAIQQVSLNPALTQQEIYFTFNVSDKENLGFLIYLQSQASTALTRITVINPMIVEGEKTLQEMKALKYQPYHQQITWIPLREPLRKIATSPDYSDTIDKDGNVTVKVVTRHVKDLEITATRPPYGVNNDVIFTMAYIKSGYGEGGLGSYPNNDFAGSASLCNQFKMLRAGTLESEEGFGAGTLGVQPHYITIRYKYSRIGKTSADTDTVIKEAITQWVQENDPVLYLTLQPTSQFIDLYKYKIPAVYIETYDQETNVRCLNKVKPSDMTLDYKISMSSLIKRLEALESKTVQEV